MIISIHMNGLIMYACEKKLLKDATFQPHTHTPSPQLFQEILREIIFWSLFRTAATLFQISSGT